MFEKLTENWALKLVSLTFALILWFFVMGERKLEVGYSVPLELENLPPGLMIANDIPTSVDVRISGPRTILMNLHPRDIRISVDLKGLPPGLSSFRRLEERLNLPSGVRVTRLSPSYIDIRLERVRQKRVPVEPVLVGSPAQGARIVEVLVTPAQVIVEGAENELREISHVPAGPIDVGGAAESFSRTVPLNFQGKYTMLQNYQTAEVRVRIEAASGVPEGEGAAAPAVPVAPPSGRVKP